MIIFNKLDIISFKGIFNCSIDFNDLGNNLYSLEGINHTVEFSSSNGAGKSTIFDALLFVLYGLTNDTSLKKIDYQNKNTNIKMKIKLNLTIQNINYTIQRTEKEFKLYNSDNEDISELNNSDTEKKFLSILNLTKSEFCNFTYLSQNNSSSFLNKTPTEKLDIIKDFIYGEDILNLERKINTYYNDIQNKINEIKLEQADLNGKFSVYDSMLKQDIIDYPHELSYYEERYNEIDKIIKDYDLVKNHLSSVKTKVNSYINTKKNLVEKYNIAKENICPTCGQILQDNNVILTIINKIKQVNENLTSLKSEYEDLVVKAQSVSRSDIENMIKEKKEISEIISNIKNQNKLKNSIEKFKKDYDNLLIRQENLSTSMFKYQAQLQQIKDIQKFFKTDFISYIQQQFIKDIENYLNIYCYDIFNGSFKLTFSNNNLILSIDDKPYSYFSGGEKERIDFIFVFAVKIALTHFTNKCTNLFIADESLRGQDSKAFENCLDVINNLTQTENITTILISHRDVNYESNKIIIEKFDKFNKITIEK